MPDLIKPIGQYARYTYRWGFRPFLSLAAVEIFVFCLMFLFGQKDPTCPALVSSPDTTLTYTPATGPYYPGTVATYACQAGNEIVGVSATRKYQDDGTWNGVEPHCTPAATCPALVASPDTTLTYTPATGPYYPGSVATYDCQAGYEIVGVHATRKCQDDGTWNGVAPHCTPKSCGPLAYPAHGHVVTDVTTLNSVATYSCNPGYTLGTVSPSRICEAAGWSGSAPTCSAVDCGIPPAPANGDVSASATTYRSTATYTCKGNYQLMGDVTRTCLNNGTWSGSVPICGNTLALGLGVGLLLAGLLYYICRKPASEPGRAKKLR